VCWAKEGEGNRKASRRSPGQVDNHCQGETILKWTQHYKFEVNAQINQPQIERHQNWLST